MKKVLFTRERLKHSFLFGALAAVAYILPVLYFFYDHDYENLYLLFIGTALFMAVIFYYQVRLLGKPYEKDRAIAMVLDGHMAVIFGVILDCALILLLSTLTFGNLLDVQPTQETLQNAPPTMAFQRPVGMILRVLAITVMGNTAGGAFISVIVTYAGKRNQMRDKPVNFKPTPSSN